MKKRLVALLFALVLTFSMMSFAAAADAQPKAPLQLDAVSNRIGYTTYYTLKNKETAQFYIPTDDDGNELYDAKGIWYRDITFDTANTVKAASTAAWVHISNQKNGFTLWYDRNGTQKSRTATVTFTAKGYKAKVKLTQFGSVKVNSVTRNKKTVTVKFKLPAGCTGASIQVEESKYKTDGDGYSVHTYRYFGKDIAPGTTAYKFTAKKGMSYDVWIEPIVKLGTANHQWLAGAGYASFTVDSVTGKESY